MFETECNLKLGIDTIGNILVYGQCKYWYSTGLILGYKQVINCKKTPKHWGAIIDPEIRITELVS